MNMIKRLWWSLGRGNRVVPSRWLATPAGGPRTDRARRGPRLLQREDLPASRREHRHRPDLA
jgi:hypothetical protein